MAIDDPAQATDRYRFVSPWAGVVPVVGIGAAFTVSVLLAVVVAAVFAGLIWVLLRIGADISSGGVTIHRIRGSRFVPWEEVGALEVVEDWNFGQRIVAVTDGGERLVLPAPTSKTGGLREGLERARRELAARRGPTGAASS